MTRTLSLALVAALLACAALWWQNQGLKTDLAEERAARAEEHAQRERERRAYEDAINQGVRKATDAYMARAQAARRDAAGIDAAYRGVLDAINAAGGTADDPAAACRADAERVRVLTRLLAEGAGLAAEGAQRVGKLDAQVTGLQDHAAAVAGPSSPASEVSVNR